MLPAEIHTSARRFETEGLFRRQLLNALIMNAAAIGWHEFLDQAPGLYRRQGDSGRLELLPFFQGLQRLFQEMPHDQRRRTWYRSGTYVRNNAWQLLFAVDAWRGLRRNPARRGDNTSVLDRWEPWVDRCSDHPGGRLLATALVWAWFHVTLTTLQLRTKLSAIIHPKGKDHAADRL